MNVQGRRKRNPMLMFILLPTLATAFFVGFFMYCVGGGKYKSKLKPQPNKSSR